MSSIFLITGDLKLKSKIVKGCKSGMVEVIHSSDLQGALNYICNFLPDVTLIDISSLKTNCENFIKQLRDNPYTSCLPVIVLTEKFVKKEFRDFIEAGANDYLTRGSNAEEIIKAIYAQLKKVSKVKRNYENKLNEFKRYLTSVMPHEFNTPLTAILGFTDALKSEFQNLTAEDAGEMLNYIKDSALRLKSTADKIIIYSDVLALGTILSGDETLARATVVVDQLLFKKIITENEKIRNRQNDIEINVTEGKVIFLREYLLPVIEEILENACKFSAPGTRIAIQGRTILYKYHLQITDEGVGLPPGFINRISAFNQYNRDKYEQQGLGLGLAIVKTAMNSFGGELEFESVNHKKTIAKLLFKMPEG